MSATIKSPENNQGPILEPLDPKQVAEEMAAGILCNLQDFKDGVTGSFMAYLLVGPANVSTKIHDEAHRILCDQLDLPKVNYANLPDEKTTEYLLAFTGFKVASPLSVPLIRTVERLGDSAQIMYTNATSAGQA